MAPCATVMPPVKYKGIHEPKGRVKGYRVEIRPPSSKTKIWVGTFDSRDKAKRAFDAAVYLSGKEPYYFVYPVGYFSSRPATLSKEDVQAQAKVFAERTDDLAARDVSRPGASSKVGQAKNLGSERTIAKPTILKKGAGKMNSPHPPVDMKSALAGLDRFLQEGPEYLELPNLLDLTSCDFLQVQSKEVEEEHEVDLENSAYLRGLTSKQDILESFSDAPLPAPDDFPAIEYESLYLNFDASSKLSSKRKRGLSQDMDFLKNSDGDLEFWEEWLQSPNGSWV